MDPIAIDMLAGEIYWWCRCGLSRHQPLCDGAHKGGAGSPLKYVSPVDRRALLCVCKRTATPPFCDGAHARTG